MDSARRPVLLPHPPASLWRNPYMYSFFDNNLTATADYNQQIPETFAAMNIGRPRRPIVNIRPPPTQGLETQIREVWSDNIAIEFLLVRSALVTHPIACIDTEFPGCIYSSSKSHYRLTPTERYALLKSNVDSMKLAQVGPTLSDPTGSHTDMVWQFNLSGFNPARDTHNPESIALLRKQGLDLEEINSNGIDPQIFAQYLLGSELLFGEKEVTWVGFSTGYDFAYLVKILSQQELPESIGEFMELVSLYFGTNIMDIKHLIQFYTSKLRGGLERVAEDLVVRRTAGISHQAGSDSKLTSDVWKKMKGKLVEDWEQGKSVLCGVQVS